MSIFEVMMLVCFGAAWPMNIYKSYHSRTAKGKSVVFMFTVEVGYICGMINKIVYNFDFVLFLYMLNFAMVAVDIALYYRNRKYDNMLEVKKG